MVNQRPHEDEMARRIRDDSFEGIYLAFIATFWKEPTVVQYVVALVQSLMAREDEGQGMVEYGMIIALVALVAAAGFTILGNDISAFIGGLGSNF